MRASSSIRPVRALLWLVGLWAWAALALAGEVPFNQAKFDAALAQGQPVIVDFWASWCPTCKEQKPIVQSLLKEAKRKDVHFFVADFDTETALKKRLGITMQSTFVVFKGGKEVGRATGQTTKEAIGELFDRAL